MLATEFPHKQEDLLVRQDFKPAEYWPDQVNNLFSILDPLSNTKMTDIFGAEAIIDGSDGQIYVEGRCYIEEETECPSVGVLKIKIGAMKFIFDDKRRLQFNDGEDVYTIPWNSTTDWKYVKRAMLERNLNEEVLVIVGAARGLDFDSWDAARCYLLCHGIYFQN